MKRMTMIFTVALVVDYDPSLEDQEVIENEAQATLRSFTDNFDEYVDLPSEVANFESADVGFFTSIPTPTR